MILSESQADQVITALAGAFERHELAGLAHADAGVTVALHDDDTTATYAARLVRVAARQERLDGLVLAALRARPDNASLVALVAGALGVLYGGKKTPVTAEMMGVWMSSD